MTDGAVLPDDPITAARPSPAVASVTVIADDGWWSQGFVDYLASEGFDVVADPGGHSAFDVRARKRDAMVIDLGLTARSGIAVCAACRRRSDASILAVSSSAGEQTVLNAYAAGADHVASLDTSHRQLVARLRSLLRRNPPRRVVDHSAPQLSVVLLDDGRGASVEGRELALTEQEYEILHLLVSRAGAVVSRQELAQMLTLSSSDSRAVDFSIRRLRDKLEALDTKRRIVAVRGVGFRFEVDRATGSGGPT